MKKMLGKKLLIGSNEWCQLPDLHLPAIKAKVDTGAKTSALHAVNITPHIIKHKKYVSFDVLPIQANDKIVIHCRAPVIDERYIMSSNGHKERRYVIETAMVMNELKWNIELTLSNRDPLRYRMLLGREALSNRVLIHPGMSCHLGNLTKREVKSLYSKKHKK